MREINLKFIHVIEKIERFAKKKSGKLGLLLIGGLAMSFYGLPRFTMDIDGEIKCKDTAYFELLKYLRNEKITFNIGKNINAWEMIPLPAGYRKRARTVYKSKYLVIKTLEAIDFIFSKLLRGTETDFQDIINVVKKYNITASSLERRQKFVRFPKDPETLFFRKKFSHLLALLKSNK